MPSKVENALIWIVDILNKHQVPFQISGGFGVHLYGGTRAINDIDIDIPNEKFPDILPAIKKHLTFGPDRYQDQKWDLNLITLNYKEQIIDLSGAFGAKIYDANHKIWQPYPCEFKTAQLINIYGIVVSVMNPRDLLAYKKLLDGAHQQEDIIAMERYIKNL